MPQTAKVLTFRVLLTNTEGQTVVFEGAYQVPLEELLRHRPEQLEAAYRSQFAGALFNLLVTNDVVWGTTIGQPEAIWAKPKPVVLLPNGRES